jgi:hypothetical protein
MPPSQFPQKRDSLIWRRWMWECGRLFTLRRVRCDRLAARGAALLLGPRRLLRCACAEPDVVPRLQGTSLWLVLTAEHTPRCAAPTYISGSAQRRRRRAPGSRCRRMTCYRVLMLVRRHQRAAARDGTADARNPQRCLCPRGDVVGDVGGARGRFDCYLGVWPQSLTPPRDFTHQMDRGGGGGSGGGGGGGSFTSRVKVRVGR